MRRCLHVQRWVWREEEQDERVGFPSPKALTQRTGPSSRLCQPGEEEAAKAVAARTADTP